MNLKRILDLCFLCVGCLSITCVSCAAESATSSERPNILFIAVDDLRPEFSIYGVEGIHTPTMDRLAQSSHIFERAYCQVAVCGASRASLMTSRRPNRQRFLGYDSRADRELPDAVTLQRSFRDAGYEAISLGKIYHFAEDGAEDWSRTPWLHEDYFPGYAAHSNEFDSNTSPVTEIADVPHEAYPDGQLTTRALETLKDLGSRDEPFFLGVGYSKPHLPFAAPKKYWDLYDPENLPGAAWPQPPLGSAPFSTTISGEFRFYGNVPKDPAVPFDAELEKHLKHGYWACVSFIDDEVGRLLEGLEAQGLADNTIVVLWGDHGFHLDDLGMWGKSTNYDYGTRVPLIIRHPDFEGGQRVRGIVELLDLYPTLCEWAGIEPPASIDGESFASLLEADQPKAGLAYSQYTRSKGRIGFAVRTDRYRYVEWQMQATGEVIARELYDYAFDPLERINLAEDPKRADVIALMADLLHQEAAGAL